MGWGPLARWTSSMFQAASLQAKRGTSPIEVFDTATAARGEGPGMVAAARAAHDGRPLGEVREVAGHAAEGAEPVVTLDDLEHLSRGGRLPTVARRLGALLQVQPLPEFRGGAIHPPLPTLSRRPARRRMLARWFGS